MGMTLGRRMSHGWRRRFLGVLGVGLLGVAIAACSSTSSTTTTSASTSTTKTTTPVKVTIAAFAASMPSLPVFTAASLGYFKKFGIEPTVLDVATGAAAASALASGAAQIGIVTVPEVVNLHQKGESFQIVAPLYTGFPQTLWCRTTVKVPHPTTYKSVVTALKGKSVGMTAQGSLTSNMLDYTLIAAGAPITAWNIVPYGTGPTGIAELKSGALDCAIAYQPMQYQLKQTHLGHNVLSYQNNKGPALFSNYLYTGLGGEKSYLAANPNVAKKVQEAISAASAYIADPSHAAKVAAAVSPDFSSMSVAALTTIIKHTVSKDVSSKAITKAQIDNAQTVGVAVKTQSVKLPYTTILYGAK